MPALIRVSANVCDAIVAPDVVDAVAAAISIPDTGANTNVGIFNISRRLIISYCNADAFMIPASVPVPIRRIDTPTTLLKPYSVIDITSFIFPVTIMLISPPTGSAIRGSIDIPAIGLNASKIITTTGPHIALKNPGNSLSVSATASPASIAVSFRDKIPARIIVTTSAHNAGMTFLSISEVKST